MAYVLRFPKLDGFFELRRAAADHTEFEENNMKKVLVAAPLRLAGLEIEASQFISQVLNQEADIVPAASLPWQKLRANEGGWNQAYAWVAREYHTLVVCLHPQTGALSRGLFSMAEAMLAAGKRVASWNGAVLRPVKTIRETKKDWKTNYGEVCHAD